MPSPPISNAWRLSIPEHAERQPRQLFLRAVCPAPHQVLASDLDPEAVASLVEHELLPVDGHDTVENALTLHGEVQ